MAVVGNDSAGSSDSGIEDVTTFTCPVCLDEIVDSPDNTAVFRLRACQHKVCGDCLRAYVSSKIRDGIANIHCCHFTTKSLGEGDVSQACDVLIAESDIEELLSDEDGNECLDNWCDAANPSIGVAGRISVWDRYQQLKFEERHGKDCVRRCPSCDQAQLFDEESMRRFKLKHLCSPASPAIVAQPSPNGTSPGNRRYYERFVGALRGQLSQQQQPTVRVVSAAEEAKTGNAEVLGEANSTTARNETKEVLEDDEEMQLTRSKVPVVNCTSCNCEFCYFHSNAHQGEDCATYHRRSSQQDQANVDYLNNVLKAKPCPQCGMAVSKSGGCNQIKCPNCQVSFCWICGQIVTDDAFPEHFRWWNLRGCANMQLDEGNEPKRFTRVMAKALSVAQIIVLGPISVALTLCTIVICPCLFPGCGGSFRERIVNSISFYGSFISTLIMLPFTCIAFLLLAIFYCIVTSVLLVFKVCTTGGRTRVMETQRRSTGEADASLARPVGATVTRGPHTATAGQGQGVYAGNDSSGERNTDLNSSDMLREIAAIFAMEAEAEEIFTHDEEATDDQSPVHLVTTCAVAPPSTESHSAGPVVNITN